MARMRSWAWRDLDMEFLRGVRARLSPGWFWDADDVPFLLEDVALEIRERLREPGDRLVFPGLGVLSVEETELGDGTRSPRVRILPASDWRIGKEEK